MIFNGKKSTLSLLNKKLFRSLRESYKQYLAIFLISFLAVCLFNGLISNGDLIKRRVDNLYQEGNIADLYVTLSPFAEYGEKDDLYNLDSNITDISYRINLPSSYKQKNLSLLINENENDIAIPIIDDGDDSSFCITSSFADTYDLKVGDTISIEINNSFLNIEELNQYLSLLGNFVLDNGKNILNEAFISVDFTISSIMYFPEGVSSSQFSDSYIYAKKDYAFEVFYDLFAENYDLNQISTLLTLMGYDFNSNSIFSMMVNQILIKTNNISKSKNALENYLGNKALMIIDYNNLPSNSSVMLDVEQAQKLTYVFPTIFFLVSILIIATTLNQLILKERLQIGAMKSLGMKAFYIYLHYMSYGFSVCLLGGLLGFIIGPLTLPMVMEIKYALLWDMPSLSSKFFLPLNIVSLIIILLISIIISFLSLRHTVSSKPVDLLRNVPPKVKGGKLTKIKFLSLTSKMSLRNIISSKTKSAMIFLGTMGCTALLVCGFGVMDTLNYGIDLDMKSNTAIPLTVSMNTTTNDYLKQIKEIDGVNKVEGAITYPVTLTYGDSASQSIINLLSVEDSSFINFSYENGVAIPKNLADSLSINIGDTLIVTYNSQNYFREVVTIFETSILNGIYDYYGNYQNLISYNNYYLDYDSNKLNSVENELLKITDVNEVLTKEDKYQEAENLLSSIKTMTNVIKIFAIALSIVVIYNLISLNITSRQRDIATMKVLGFHFNEIRLTLIKEVLILTFLGTFSGLFLGYPFCVLTLSINQTNLISFIYHIYFQTYLISFLISILSAVIIELLLTLRIKKISMVESLKSVE